ncbi:hypothetical protein CYMTET_34347 [Cymbomonas tetramitiformis]|uniref:RCK N-terminal domain-containing protein n=1 Tax=Cymbomonas tetramitiformis TaxID=36881 RepID=A0AAE0FBV2_9CHLO|nr:hypothetical protein CYMTET_34347 [Cymbomonas tetramitiformis]
MQPTVFVVTKLRDMTAFFDFFQEFFHEVRAVKSDVRMVVLTPTKPNFALRTFQEVNASRLTVVEGSVLNDKDLERVQAHAASAWVLLADQLAEDPVVEDTTTLLAVLALKHFTSGSVSLFVQVLERSARRRIEPFLAPESDVCMSIRETEAELLVLAARCTGGSTLVNNFVLSMAPMRPPPPTRPPAPWALPEVCPWTAPAPGMHRAGVEGRHAQGGD